jgi:hypothetical protein
MPLSILQKYTPPPKKKKIIYMFDHPTYGFHLKKHIFLLKLAVNKVRQSKKNSMLLTFSEKKNMVDLLAMLLGNRCDRVC